MMQRTVYLSLLALAVSLASASVRGAEETGNETGSESTAPRTSNMESWQTEEDRRDNWTWFGMGYESRRAASPVGGSSATGNTGGGTGKGGPGGRKP
jgi:hypothetical protein